MDKVSAHKHDGIRTLIEACGATVKSRSVPSYSPDLNPIKKCWSKVKAWLDKTKARTFDDLVDAIAAALRAVSKTDTDAWFAHCGYAALP